MKKYAQINTLSEIFDLSPDYFKKRMNNDFIEGVHYFIPPTRSRTKRAILWSIEATEKWICGNDIDVELDQLLRRR